MSLLFEFTVWERVDLFGLLLVTIGCAGEFWLLIKPSKRALDSSSNLAAPPLPVPEIPAAPLITSHEKSQRKLEIGCVLLVVAGLALELVALPMSLIESHGEIARIEVERLKLSNSVEVLRKSNLELAKQLAVLDPIKQPVRFAWATAKFRVNNDARSTNSLAISDLAKLKFVKEDLIKYGC